MNAIGLRKEVKAVGLLVVLLSATTIAGAMSARVNPRFSTAKATVSWSYKDGVVRWSFYNPTDRQYSLVLQRNGLYFDTDFWPVYASNGWAWAAGVPSTAPMTLGLIDFGKGQRLIAFVITLAPHGNWSTDEYGFLSPPSGVIIHQVIPESIGRFCLGYDPRQVTAWSWYAGKNLSAYSPNPNAFALTEFRIEPDASYSFNQAFSPPTIANGVCA